MEKHYLVVLFLISVFFTSFSSAQSTEPLVRGRTLQKDSLLLDLHMLEKALTEAHPGIYRYNQVEDIRHQFERLRRQVYDGMTESMFMKQLAKTVVQIKCGHTYLNPWNMPYATRKRLFGGNIYLPIGFEVVDGRFYLTHKAFDEEDFKTGAEILSINGHSTQAIYDSLKTITKRDGNNTSPASQYLSMNNFGVRPWQFFDLYFPLFFPLTAPKYELTYRNYDSDQIHEISIDALSKKQRAEAMEKKYGSNVNGKKRWSLDLSHPNLAIMELNDFAIWNWKGFDQAKWFQQAFDTIQQLGITNLVVDIRSNSGGLTEPKNELISYLTPQKIDCSRAAKTLIRTTQVDSIFKPYVETWVPHIYTGLPAETYEVYKDGFYLLKGDGGCQDILPKEKGFKGKTYFFGGATNVSATFDLLNKAQKFEFGTFIGETTGGNQQGINGGQYLFLTLPYSQIEVDIPLIYYQPSTPRPDAGVQPDVTVKRTQADIAQQRDPHLEYVLKEIGER